jgi:hypothetical protein
LPLPGSPLIQSRRLLWLCCHCLNSLLSRIQRYESLSSPPLIFLIRSLSSTGLVVRRSRRHAWSSVSDCTKAVHYSVPVYLSYIFHLPIVTFPTLPCITPAWNPELFSPWEMVVDMAVAQQF